MRGNLVSDQMVYSIAWKFEVCIVSCNITSTCAIVGVNVKIKLFCKPEVLQPTPAQDLLWTLAIARGFGSRACGSPCADYFGGSALDYTTGARSEDFAPRHTEHG